MILLVIPQKRSRFDSILWTGMPIGYQLLRRNFPGSLQTIFPILIFRSISSMFREH